MFPCRDSLGRLLFAFGMGMIIASFFQSVLFTLLLGLGFLITGILVAK